MKALNVTLAISMIFSLTAHAMTDSEAAALAQGSQAEANAAVQERNANLLQKVNAVSDLEKQIANAKAKLAHDQSNRTTSIVLTVVSAAALGLSVRYVNAANEFAQVVRQGIVVIGGTTTLVGAAEVGLSSYDVIVDQKSLSDLEARLASVKSQLQSEINALR